MQKDRGHQTLFVGLPNHRTPQGNTLSCRKIANDLSISFQAVYRWFERGRVPTHHVRNLVALEGSLLTIEAVMPFFLIDEQTLCSRDPSSETNLA